MENLNSTLFPKKEEEKNLIFIGEGLFLRRLGSDYVEIYRGRELFNVSQIKPAIEKRLLIVDLVEKRGAIKSRLADALGLSRQSIDNWVNTYRKSGTEGLVNSYKGKDIEAERSKNFQKLPVGNKARILEQDRKLEREEIEKQKIQLNFPEEENGENQERPELFNNKYDFEENRYAGSFLYWGIFQHYFRFMEFIESHLGRYSVIVYLYALMQINGIESVERLKTVFKLEFGRILGIKKLFSLPVIRELIHSSSKLKKSLDICKRFFKRQARLGIVSLWRLFIDGHFIPYSGETDIHKGFYTQRGLMMPGQTEIFVHDSSGKIVYFEIQEGKGDISSVVSKMSHEWSHYLGGVSPLVVVDRELWSIKTFLSLKDVRFITWEKWTNVEELAMIAAEKFGDIFKVNETEYQIYETRKTYRDNEGNSIRLRQIIIWNKKQDRRVAVVTQDELEDSQTIAESMLNRWGTNENGFKHMGNRINMHYNPLLDISGESENQEINNPEYKELNKKRLNLKKEIDKLERKLEKTPLKLNKNGSIRENSKRSNLLVIKDDLEKQLIRTEYELSKCPERVNLSEIKEGKSFKEICTEGKNLWDLAETLVWNSRKKLIEDFCKFLPNKRDLIPVLEAITRCKGWIKSTSEIIAIQLEPLDIPRFKAAQIQLCRELNNKNIRLSNGKLLQYDVRSEQK